VRINSGVDVLDVARRLARDRDKVEVHRTGDGGVQRVVRRGRAGRGLQDPVLAEREQAEPFVLWPRLCEAVACISVTPPRPATLRVLK
jgi:hypothetical protein